MAAAQDKEIDLYNEIKHLKKYDYMLDGYDSYEQSDYEIEPEDIYPKRNQ